MEVTYTCYKNSNTGELIKKQSFTECKINFPDNYYDVRGQVIETIVDLTGFVEISFKKFKRESKKQLKV